MTEDTGTFLAGVAIGMLLVCFRMALNLQRVYITPETKGKKVNLIRLRDIETGEEAVYVNPDTFKQSLELFYTLATWNFSGRKENIIFQNKARQEMLFRNYVILIVIAVSYSLYAILDIIQN